MVAGIGKNKVMEKSKGIRKDKKKGKKGAKLGWQTSSGEDYYDE